MPWARPRQARSGVFFTLKAPRLFEKELRSIVEATKPPIFDGAVGVSLIFNLTKPKSVKNRLYPEVRPDLDNYSKLVIDSLNRLLYRDDAQVCQLTSMKRYAEKNSIAISIFEL